MCKNCSYTTHIITFTLTLFTLHVSPHILSSNGQTLVHSHRYIKTIKTKSEFQKSNGLPMIPNVKYPKVHCHNFPCKSLFSFCLNA